MKWWGWGDPERRLERRGGRDRRAALGGGGGAAGRARVASSRLPFPRRFRCRHRSPRRWARRPCSTATSIACGGRPAAAIRTWCACAPDAWRMRPTRSCCRAARTSLRACWRSAGGRASAVVPFGGGTSVVGGVEPLRGAFERLITLDLRRLQGVEVDHTSMTATLGPGLRGPEAEEALAAQGVTLGHFPQSFEYATIGGFAATRSAGQASSGYGRFDELVTSPAADRAGGHAQHAQDPAYGRRALAARARPGLGGCARGDHRGHREGAPCARAAPLRGAGWRPTSHREPTSCALWRSRGAFPM